MFTTNILVFTTNIINYKELRRKRTDLAPKRKSKETLKIRE